MYLYIGVLCFCAVVGCLIGGFVSGINSIAYAALIHIPFIACAIILNVIFNAFITAYSLSGTKKAVVTVVSIFLYIVKYIILLMGLIIGVIVNACTHLDYFSIYALVGYAFIYPIGAIISTIHYSIIERKKDKAKKKQVYNEASSYIAGGQHEEN